MKSAARLFPALCLGFFGLLAGVNAHASGGVVCFSKDGQAEFQVGMGRLPIYAPLNATARLGKQHWSTDPQSGETPLGDSQGMWEKERLAVDFTDADFQKIIISLRVDLTAAEKEEGYPAVLTFHDISPINVDCLFE